MKPSKIERQAQWNLIQIAEAWCTATGSNLSAVGRQAVGDSRFFTNLKERYAAGDRCEGDRQGSVTFRVYDETILWFCQPANWPDGAAPALELADFSHTKGKHYGAPAKVRSTSDILTKLRRKIL